MVQAYAAAELLKEDCREELTKRWLDWLLEFTRKYGIDLEFHVEKTQTVGLEYLHLLNTIRWCYKHEQWEMLLQITEGIWFYPYILGLFSELREMLEAALTATSTLRDEQREGRFIYRIGKLFWVQGQYEIALNYLDKAEWIVLRYKNDTELAWIYNVRSHILSHQGHMSEAEKLAVKMLEIGKHLNHLGLKVRAANRLSTIESQKHRFDKALEWLDRSDEWQSEISWLRGAAWSMYLRGTTLIAQGNTVTAEPFLMQSLNMATSWNERRLMAHNKHLLAQAYLETERLQLALQMAEEARDLYERLGMIKDLADIEELLQKLPGNNSDS